MDDVGYGKVAASCGITSETFAFCESHGHDAVVAMANSTPPHPGRVSS